VVANTTYDYIIVGGGLAGVSAARGIRELDKDGSVLLIGAESHLPYHRPPLTKGLWFGKKKVEDIFVEGPSFYDENKVETLLNTTVTAVDAGTKTVTVHTGAAIQFGNLLLATGGTPRKLPIPGGDHPEICYYRSLDDYRWLRERAKPGTRTLVIGGGFIGSEIAAGLINNEVAVTMVFPESFMCGRVFPEYLGTAMVERYREKGARIVTGDVAARIEKQGDTFVTTTREGERIESDLVIAGLGIVPAADLAHNAGLKTDPDIVVDEYLRTSHPDIFAAGDNASFPYESLGRRRIEHWDSALAQGAHAGRNMAGAGEPFTYLPYFFSDLFDFGYEAVGDTDPSLETVTDWQKENDTGVIYYLRDHRVRGVMMCNVWEKVDEARELIRQGKEVTEPELHEAI
jgi:NADPH-dependent 2,4-dienoyl-CoA reductase/sulfur reductase-like enzyme